MILPSQAPPLSSECSRRGGAPRRGFALLLAIVLMALLLLATLGLSSLVQLASRTSEDAILRGQAHLNSQFSVKVALGRLQAATGNDRRVTALSEITAPPEAGWDQRNAFWTGVWRDDREIGELLTYSAPRPTFVEWLVSMPRDNPVEPSAAWNALEHPVLMHAGGGDNDPNEGRVYVPSVEIRFGAPGGGAEPDRGRHAFWISDEGVKARINVVAPDSFSVSASATEQDRWRLRSPQRAGWELLTLFQDLPDGFNVADIPNNLGRTRRLSDLEHWRGALDPVDTHDLTTVSMGLLTDTRRGGHRMDLTHYLSQPEGSVTIGLEDWDITPVDSQSPPLSTSLGNLALMRMGGSYSRAEYRNPNRSFSSPTAKGHPTPRWIRQHREVSWASPDSVTLTPPSAAAQAHHPVLVGAALYFDFTRQGSQLMLNVFPVYLVWNPYNVAIEETTYTVHQILNFDIYFHIRGSVQLPNGSWFTQNIDTTAHMPLRLRTMPGGTGGETAATFNVPDLRLEPGQVVVLAPAEFNATFESGPNNNGTNNILAPNDPDGWNNEHSFLIDTGFTLPGWPDVVEMRYRHTREGQTGQGTYYLEPRLFEGVVSTGDITNLASAWNADMLSSLRLFFIRQPGGTEPATNHPWYNVPPTAEGVQRGRVLNQGNLDEFDMVGLVRGPSNTMIMPHSGDDRSLAIRTYAHYSFRAPYHWRNESDRAGGGLYSAVPTINRHELQAENSTVDMLDNFASPENPRNFLGPFFELLPEDASLLSVGQLTHVNWGSRISHPTYALGNSIPPMYLSMHGSNYSSAADQGGGFDPAIHRRGVRTAIAGGSSQWTDEGQVDLSFLMNEALWDRFFFSTIPSSGSLTPQPSFVLPNSRYRILPTSNGAPPATSDLRSLRGPAEHLGVVGGFNINSTRVEAWKSVLGSFRGAPVRLANGIASGSAEAHPFPRLTHPFMSPLEPSGSNTRDERSYWGYRALTDTEIETLAEAIVAEIKRRARPDPNQDQIETAADPDEFFDYAPALSLADFVNRRLVNTRNDGLAQHRDVGVWGPLQAAINQSGLNDGFLDEEILENETARRMAEHAAGPKATNAPGYLSQADLLQSLAPILSARSDTFTIRSVGLATQPVTGAAQAESRFEAVAQRLAGNFDDPDLTSQFGRPYRLIQMRRVIND